MHFHFPIFFIFLLEKIRHVMGEKGSNLHQSRGQLLACAEVNTGIFAQSKTVVTSAVRLAPLLLERVEPVSFHVNPLAKPYLPQFHLRPTPPSLGNMYPAARHPTPKSPLPSCPSPPQNMLEYSLYFLNISVGWRISSSWMNWKSRHLKSEDPPRWQIISNRACRNVI